MDPRPGDRLAHYELLSRIGGGGMGVVWKALDTHLNRIVALKFLCGPPDADPGCIARLEREARAVAAVRHPGVVTIYSIEQVAGTPFLTMELVEGSTLARVVPDAGLPLATFFAIAEALVDAIGAAHAHGIAHRDLKPSNVLVTGSGEVKVVDFGIAAVLAPSVRSDSAPTQAVTRSGHVLGTPPYMAPEQLLHGDCDHRADLFSLGAILYFMLTGRDAFAGPSAAAVVAAVLRDTPMAIARIRPEVPAGIASIVDRCLEKTPNRRYQTAREVAAALGEVRATAHVDAGAHASIAVLPFDDLSVEHDQDYFCEGVAEEIILTLSRVRGLRVASRSSSFGAKARIADRRELAAHLGVDTLLEGSVRKAGSRLRITVELTDVATQYQLWGDRYDRDLQDVFAIQDDIAQRVAEALCCRLSDLQRTAAPLPTAPAVQAYDFYLRGRKFLHQYSRKGAEFARQMFAQALAVDPAYARAQAGIAECHAFLYLYAGHHRSDLDAADTASRRSLDLSPDLAEAHAARGIALSLAGAYDEAIAEFESATRLNPDLFDVHYFHARTCFAAGRFDAAVRSWERASAIRPDDYQSPLLVAQAYEQLGRASDAETARRRGVEIVTSHLMLAPDDVRALYMGANGLVALGRRDEGLTWARRALALDPDEPMLLYNIGCIYALASDAAAAFECLERAVSNGLSQREWFLNDPNLDCLRKDARFERVMAAIPAGESA